MRVLPVIFIVHHTHIAMHINNTLNGEMREPFSFHFTALIIR